MKNTHKRFIYVHQLAIANQIIQIIRKIPTQRNWFSINISQLMIIAMFNLVHFIQCHLRRCGNCRLPRIIYDLLTRKLVGKNFQYSKWNESHRHTRTDHAVCGQCSSIKIIETQSSQSYD
ncbi:hypothetical protein Tsp_01146 [Trichinella spiralis]|uniref:hypothetical protein n=1 Tax=Trichinella spiralis TaxID=6334 RepID=UPI0001EFC466|nr:hypothetical protein Tsp_01146 [Trichinella spiralis]